MTLDEAIKHCEEVARGCECEARQCDESDGYESHVKAESLNCAADHRQLAEWLTELKERRAADVQPVNMFMSDRCIVCYHDVRKDTAYYDINGATVCEGCMSVKCRVEKEG